MISLKVGLSSPLTTGISNFKIESGKVFFEFNIN